MYRLFSRLSWWSKCEILHILDPFLLAAPKGVGRWVLYWPLRFYQSSSARRKMLLPLAPMLFVTITHVSCSSSCWPRQSTQLSNNKIFVQKSDRLYFLVEQYFRTQYFGTKCVGTWNSARRKMLSTMAKIFFVTITHVSCSSSCWSRQKTQFSNSKIFVQKP